MKKELSETMQECKKVLEYLQNHEQAVAFLEPVDWEAYGLMDYPSVIKHPMDLGTVEQKLQKGQYKEDVDAFARDVRLVWQNACKYNRPDSDIYKVADMLHKQFDKRFGKISKGTPSSNAKRRKTGGNVVTKEDREKFAQLVNSLLSEELGQLVDKIQKECPEAINELEDEDEIEIEINAIESKTLMDLIAWATKCISKRKKS